MIAIARKVLSAEESTDSRESKGCGSIDVEDLGVRPSAVDETQVQLVLPPRNVITVDSLTYNHILSSRKQVEQDVWAISC